jgi:polysaccharide deacetylase family protein (PEP-CTERM system associated)
MNILTFDIEEWFHLLDNDSTKTEAQWSNYESRIHKNMETIYNIIESSNSKASFFVVGWIAEKYPEVVREINRRGYEIGSHTHLHQLVYEQDRNTFYKDVDRSIKTIEDCIGSKVSMFRAPGFSITEENKWAFEVLHELGIEIDCSVFPASRSHGGLSSFGAPKPSVINYNGVEIKELPINYTSILSKPVIFSGGGYFRLFPYPLIKKWTQSSDYVMTYFHPRDFDAGQPLIQDLSKARKFKSYVGIKGAEKKLDRWLQDFEFIDIETADKQIDWGKVPMVKL